MKTYKIITYPYLFYSLLARLSFVKSNFKRIYREAAFDGVFQFFLIVFHWVTLIALISRACFLESTINGGVIDEAINQGLPLLSL